MTKKTEESLYNFTMDGGVGSVYDYAEEKKDVDEKLELLTTWIEPSKRERKKNYNENAYFKDQLGTAPGAPKGPKLPKMPVTYDFQFYNSGRLTQLIEIERNALTLKHERMLLQQQRSDDDADEAPLEDIRELTEEEQQEKEKLLTEGFQEWSKRDFNNYIRACEKFGRHAVEEICGEMDGKSHEDVSEYHKIFWKRYKEIADYDKLIKKIEVVADAVEYLLSSVWCCRLVRTRSTEGSRLKRF